MKSDKNQGRLYLIPTPLAEGQTGSLSEYNHQIVKHCRYFLVESFKLGRRNVKSMAPDLDLSAVAFDEVNKETDPTQWEDLLNPVLSGHDICLMSDAGSPVIADPGNNIVRMAHRKGIQVVPIPGPSSIILALMASGFSGQQFTFHGYLDRNKNQLRNDLKKLEHLASTGYTQIFMETPYRNLAIYDQAINILTASTMFCIACDLTAPEGFVRTKTIAQWNNSEKPDIHKRPCIFLIGT